MITAEDVVDVAAVEVVVAAEEIALKVIGPALPTEVAVVENAKKVIAHRPKEVVDAETATVMVKSKRKVETVVAELTTDLAMTALPKVLMVSKATEEVRTKSTDTKESPVKMLTPWIDNPELAVANAIKEKEATVLEEQESTKTTTHLRPLTR